MDSPPLGLELFDRMERALRLVRERRARATAALGRAGIAYALVGGNAVAAWVRSVDPSAERNTPDVAIAIRQTDADRPDAALRAAGFHRIVADRAGLFVGALAP